MLERGGMKPGDVGDKDEGSLAGMLLLSHPVLRDKNFKRSAVLLAAHSAKEGAMGVILNRPLGKTLAEVDSSFADSPIGDIPLYDGGPVEGNRVIFAGWNWDVAHRRFKLHFGIEREFVEQLMKNEPETHVRGFLGYAGWSKNQLEGELKADAWAVAKVDAAILENTDGVEFWRAMLAKTSPELHLLSESPDEPENN